jgi:ABC-type nitrate/sulfonate/bicarbonate transport system ATPase subunit
LLQIVANTQSTVVMVTHDVDEAVLLSDKIRDDERTVRHDWRGPMWTAAPPATA